MAMLSARRALTPNRRRPRAACSRTPGSARNAISTSIRRSTMRATMSSAAAIRSAWCCAGSGRNSETQILFLVAPKTGGRPQLLRFEQWRDKKFVPADVAVDARLRTRRPRRSPAIGRYSSSGMCAAGRRMDLDRHRIQDDRLLGQAGLQRRERIRPRRSFPGISAEEIASRHQSSARTTRAGPSPAKCPRCCSQASSNRLGIASSDETTKNIGQPVASATMPAPARQIGAADRRQRGQQRELRRGVQRALAQRREVGDEDHGADRAGEVLRDDRGDQRPMVGADQGEPGEREVRHHLQDARRSTGRSPCCSASPARRRRSRRSGWRRGRRPSRCWRSRRSRIRS